MESAPPPRESGAPDAASGRDGPRRSNLRSQDLVTLPVLRALLRERNVTRAGEVVGLTQSATSNALARLRRRFGDELLVRVGREYQLTPLAESLLERADQALGALERLFEADFDPATSTREFTVGLSDYTLLVLSSTLVPLLRSEAPEIRLNFLLLTAAGVKGASGVEAMLRQADVLIVPPVYDEGLPNRRLLRDRWVCLVGAEAPVGDTVTIDDLASLALVAPWGAGAFPAAPPLRQLREAGVQPRVVVSVDGFQSVPYLVAGTDRAAFVPEGLARRLTDVPGVRVLPSPLPRSDHLLHMVWQPLETSDPGHQWFRDVLVRAADAAMEHAAGD